jgi:hypothetical protein
LRSKGTVLVPHFDFGRKIIWSEAHEPSETSEKVPFTQWELQSSRDL